MNTDKHGLNEISERIIRAAFAVGNGLGCGFLEKVYENALAYELGKVGLKVEQQKAVRIEYDGLIVGDYLADLIVNDAILVETKAVKRLDEIHFAQCLNYLKATEMPLCLLINFGRPRVEIRRIING